MTITELARLAHVSTSTVSKAFALLPEVSELTRNMIFEVAKANGCFKKFYRSEYPGLVFAVICPELESTYYAAFVSEMQKRLSGYSCEVAVAATGFDAETERRLIEYYRRYNTVDGIILINGVTDVASNTETPIVTVNCVGGCKGAINVSVDIQNAISSVIEGWVSKGVTDIGFIGDQYTDARLQNLRVALWCASLAEREEYFIKASGRFEACGYAGALELLKRESLPRAILCAYDRIAVGTIRAFKERGVRVPDDVAVFGVDDAPGSKYGTPSLTSVSYRVDEVCRLAVEGLMAIIKGEDFTSSIDVEPELILRESSQI